MHRRHHLVAQRLTIFLGVLVAAVALAACGGDDDGGVTISGSDGTEIEVTTEQTETPSASPTGAETGTTDATGTATSEATPSATETPDATGTPSATATPSGGGEPEEGDLAGVPYSTGDVRAAVEAAGRTFILDDERAPLCPNTSVAETVFLASDPVEATGANWALWVYPDDEVLEDDWEIDDGQLEPRSDDCELPTGFNYFNANVVMAFVSWEGADGETTFDEERSPREDAAIEAFLGLGASDEDAPADEEN